MTFTSNDELIAARFGGNKIGAGGKITVYEVDSKGKVARLIEYDVSHFKGLYLFSSYLGIHNNKELVVLKIIE